MKHTITFCLFLFASGLLFAQSPVHTIQEATPRPAYVAPSVEKTAGIVDTIYDYFDRSTDFFLLTAGTTGYTLGTNGFTEETAVHYDAIGVLKVTDIMVFVTEKEIVGDPDFLVARAYSVGNDTLPITTLGEGNLLMSQVDTSGFATFIPMSVLDSTTSDFLISIDYGNMDDSIAILSNNISSTNGGPDGNGEKRTRQKLTNGQWLPVLDIWTFGGAPMDADAMILPVIDYTEIVSVPSSISSRELSLSPPFPNPATQEVSIPFTLESAQRVEVTLYDLEGRPVWSSGIQNFTAGKQVIELETSALASGTYFFRLNAEKGALAGKFMVQN